jgi:hypothetical protein
VRAVRLRLRGGLPSGTRLSVRLNQNVYSHAVTAGQPVDTVVIAPVKAGGEVIVPAGWKLRGTVTEERRPARQGEARAAAVRVLEAPSTTAGNAVAVTGKLVAVDNARETVDAEGRVVVRARAERACPRTRRRC